MGLWIKYFFDGKKEVGSDKEIEKGNASWSKGRLDGICKCSLFGFMCNIHIDMSGRVCNWHQYDRYEVPLLVGHHKGRRIFRVIQVEISEDLLGKYLIHKSSGEFNQNRRMFLADEPDENLPSIEICPHHINTWFTVSIDLKGSIYFCFTKRGDYR